MKKLLSFLATISLSAGPVVGLSNVISCSHSSKSNLPATDIQIDATSLQITNGDDQAVKILNSEDLDSIDVTSEDVSICTVSLSGNVIKIKAIKDGSTNIIVNAKNANSAVKIAVKNSSLLEQAIPQLKTYLPIIQSLLGTITDENSFITTLQGIIPMAGGFSNIISPILTMLNGVDSQYFKMIGDAINPSVYGTMTYDQVLQAAQIRIANGIVSYISGDGQSNSNIVDWKTTNDLSKNLNSILSVLSPLITTMIDDSDSLKSNNNISTESLYSITEIIGGFIPILNYLSQFDITSESLSYNDISTLIAKQYNSDDVELNVSQLANNIDKAFDNENNMKNIIGVLFSESNSTGGESDLLLDLSSNSVTYSEHGAMAVIQSVVNGAVSSKKVQEMILEKIGQSGTSIESLIIPIVNCLPKLATFLFNGWSKDNIYISIGFGNMKLSDLLNYLPYIGITDETTVALITSVISDPLATLQPLVASMIPGIKAKSVNSIFSQLAPEIDLNKYIGRLGESSLGDVLDILKSSIGDNDKISLTGIGSMIGGFANTIEGDDNTTVLKYIANHGSEIGSADSTFWKSLGLNGTSLTDGSVLKGLSLFLVNDSTTTFAFLNKLTDALDKAYNG